MSGPDLFEELGLDSPASRWDAEEEDERLDVDEEVSWDDPFDDFDELHAYG